MKKILGNVSLRCLWIPRTQHGASQQAGGHQLMQWHWNGTLRAGKPSPMGPDPWECLELPPTLRGPVYPPQTSDSMNYNLEHGEAD
jgi:hypothetical protein